MWLARNMGGGNSKKNEPDEEEDSSDFIDIEQENGSDEVIHMIIILRYDLFT